MIYKTYNEYMDKRTTYANNVIPTRHYTKVDARYDTYSKKYTISVQPYSQDIGSVMESTTLFSGTSVSTYVNRKNTNKLQKADEYASTVAEKLYTLFEAENTKQKANNEMLFTLYKDTELYNYMANIQTQLQAILN